MAENYYLNLLESGEKLNACIMSHNAYWSYFMSLHERYPDVAIHTFPSHPSSLSSIMRRYPDDYSYENYELFVLASSELFSDYALEELRAIAIEVSKKKRTTIGYSYVVRNQGYSSYILESYNNGGRDFESKGDLEELVYDSVQMADLMAEQHMKLINSKNLVEEKKLELENKENI